MIEIGMKVHGGTDAPYVFVDLQGGSSWDTFSAILEEAQVVTIPGAGFGPGGEGFLRLSAFAPREGVEEAGRRLALMGGADGEAGLHARAEGDGTGTPRERMR